MNETCIETARGESVDLTERLGKLDTFLEQPEFLMLPTDDRIDFKAQRAAMVFYKATLDRRIGRADAAKENSAKENTDA